MMSVLLLALSIAHAQDSSAEAAAVDWKAQEAAEFEKPESTLSIEGGGSYTSGNTEFFLLTGKLAASHRFGRNKFTFGAGANFGASKIDANADGILSEGERTAGYKRNAGRFWGDLRYDRFLSPRDSLYFLVGAFRDVYAGYDWRTHEQIGYSRVIFRTEKPVGDPVAEGETQPTVKTELKSEIGVDYAQEDFVDGVDPNFDHFIAGRLMVSFLHQFSPATSFYDEVEIYESFFDVEDFRMVNEATFSTKLTDVISLKLSNVVLFDNVPVEGRRKVDQTTLITLVADLI